MNLITISNVLGGYDDYQYSYYEEPACSVYGICLTFELSENKKTFQTVVSKADGSSFDEGGTASLFWRTGTSLVESVEFEAGVSKINFEFNDPIQKGHPGHGNYFVLINKLSGSPLLTGSIYISTEYATSCSAEIDGDDIHIWYSYISGEGTKNALVYYMPEGVGYWNFFTEKKAGYSIDVNCSYENFDDAYLCKYEEQDETYKFTVSTGYDVIVKYVHEPLIISGYITSGNTFIGGVDLIGFPKSTDTDANGYYETQVPYGWSGTVRPEIWGHTFEPETVSYSNVTANISQNYSLIEIDKAILSLPHKYVNQNETGILGLGLVNSLHIKECTIQFSYDETAGFDIVELTLTKRSEDLSVSFSKNAYDPQNTRVSCQITNGIIEPGSGDILSFIYNTTPDGSGDTELSFSKTTALIAQNNINIKPVHHDGSISFYQEQSTGQPIDIDHTVIAQEYHSSMKVASYGNYVYLLADSYKNHLAKFFISSDKGKSFDNGRIIGSNIDDTEMIVNSSGHIHIFWKNWPYNLYYMKSTDKGTFFTKPRIINRENDEYEPGDDYHCFIDNQNNIYLVFQYYAKPKWEIAYIKSEDNGESFSKPNQVTYNDIQEDQPKIAVINGVIYITYWDLNSHNIYLMKSSDNFQTSTQSNNYPVEYGYDFAINDSGVLFIPYSGIFDNESDIILARSLDKGDSFDHAFVAGSPSRNQTYPRIFIENNIVHLAWNDFRHNNYEIYYSRSTNNGDSFEDDLNVTQKEDSQYIKDLCAVDNRAYLAVSDEYERPYTTEIYMLYLADKEPPVIHINAPANLSNPNDLTKITGTANDEISGIDKVEIQLTDGNNDWNVEEWQQDEIWIECEGTESWIFYKPIQWHDNALSYTLTAKATDKSDNEAYTSIQLIHPKSTITCNLSTNRMTYGESILIKGNISFDDNDIDLGGQNILITLEHASYESPKEFYAITYSSGAFQTEIGCAEICEHGEWFVTASIRGNTNFAGSESPKKSFTVKKARPELIIDTSIQRAKLDQNISIRGKISLKDQLNQHCNDNMPVILEIKHENSDPTFLTVTTNNDYGHFLIEEYEFNQLGNWSLTAYFEGSNGVYTTTTQPLDIEVVENVGHAIIVQGKSLNNEGIKSHAKTTDYVYKKFRDRGFGHEDIYYLKYSTPGGEHDIDIEVDDVPTKDNVEYAITQWADEKMEENPANLYIVMVDHGSEDHFILVNETTDKGETITSEDLSNWLTRLEGNLENPDAINQEIVIVLGFCYSGSFIQNISGNHRIVITSAAHDEQSFKGTKDKYNIREGEFFIAKFFHQIGLGKSIYHAFVVATQSTEIFTTSNNTPFQPLYSDYAPQHPLLDDNGDQNGSNQLNQMDGDGQISREIVVGVASSTSNAIMDVSILEVPEVIILDAETTTTDLSATIYMPENCLAIWAEIKQVDFSIQNDNVTEQIEMEHVMRDGRIISGSKLAEWHNLTGLFEKPGLYRVYYFIEDRNSLNIFQCKQTKIFKKKEKGTNQPPDPFNLTYPENGATNQRTSLWLQWEKTQDQDGDKIEYIVLLSKDDPIFSSEKDLKRITGLETNSCFVSLDEEWDLSRVYWKVQAIDSFGEVRESDVWSFRPDDKNNKSVSFKIALKSLCNNEELNEEMFNFKIEKMPGHQEIMNQAPSYPRFQTIMTTEKENWLITVKPNNEVTGFQMTTIQKEVLRDQTYDIMPITVYPINGNYNCDAHVNLIDVIILLQELSE
jgi:hypothetical protein